MKANSPMITKTDNETEFFAGNRKDKVGMRVREDVLDRALAGALAPQPAIGEGLDRTFDLIGVAQPRGRGSGRSGI